MDTTRGRCGQHGPIVGVYSEGGNRPGSFRRFDKLNELGDLCSTPSPPWERAGVRVRTTAVNQPRKFGSRHSFPDKMGQGDSEFQSPPTSRPTRLRPSGFNPRPPIKAGASICSFSCRRIWPKFQSSPAYKGGRFESQTRTGRTHPRFNPRPPIKAGASRGRAQVHRGGPVSILARL